MIEFVPLAQLNDREKYWIDTLGSMEPNGYNQGWAPYSRKDITKPKVRKIKKYRKRS